ncbi:DUF4124 domain-containing protein [uncultured Neptuniibacter sp.]|jgi:hypothetical protein|uniref:DUF4124 domain-containing protein n=1 Tax=uncultured Neptuniibacter sp. TaxID=502143 RepID=UPI002629FAA0|nr:DUF4124 domain-containing protein [uncultured Neptuniibacter sp.]
MRYILGFLLVAISIVGSASAAGVYIWVDKGGVKHYSDQPPTKAEKADLNGLVRKGDYHPDQINSMQPIKSKASTSVDPEPGAVSVGAKVELKNERVAPEEDSSTVGQARHDRHETSDELIRRRDRLDGYSKQERISDIKARKAQERADKRAIQEGGKTKDRSKPQTLNKKLKKYNQSKGGVGS